MRYSKKLFSVIAMALCLSLCIGNISHAKSLQYKEKNYGYPFGKNYIPESFSMYINTSGKLSLNAGNGVTYKFVTYNSKKKKAVKSYEYHGDYRGPEAVFGNRSYSIGVERSRERLYVFAIKGNTIKKKVVKKIDLKKITKNYLRDKDDYFSDFRILEILRKNNVRIFYCASTPNGPGYYGEYYGGIIDVNITTGKVKNVVSPNEFYPDSYDGKNIYGAKGKDGKVTYYRMSLKSKKTEKFTVDEIKFEDKNYPYSIVEPYFYNGQIMAICPSGKVYYGTFRSKKFELVGKINKGKHFKRYAALDFAMKSKNEFYIAYGTRAKRDKENDSSINGKIFVDKYICK